MTGVQEVIAIVGGGIAVLVGFAKVGNYVLSSFHNEHVKPVISDITHELRQNTGATTALTTALARTDESASQERAQTRATFDRLGAIQTEHEQWLRRHDDEIESLQEVADLPKAKPRIRGRKP